LTHRGVLLAIASKNREALALEAIDKHPEMVLRREDFAAWRIDWNDKAQNIAELVAELNLGLDAAVFIDDNPAERARVCAALPQVLVPDWPADKLLYAQALGRLRCFDTLALTAEDARRAQLYAAQREARQERAQVTDLEQWLESLEMRARIEPLTEVDLARAAQLLNKTNQFNLSTRRLGTEELRVWASAPQRRLWTVRLADRLGDHGLIALLSVEQERGQLRIVDFLLSCRVFGRRVEHLMVHAAVRFARSAGLERVVATYLPTPRSAPCREFLEGSGLERLGDGQTFVWSTGRDWPAPAALCVDWA
jgi:FkbH-like protein